MLLLALRFGTDKQVKAAAPRRPHVRIPKLMRYELRANIYQARDLQAADDNGLADPYVKVSLADPHPHPHPRPHPHPHPRPHPHPNSYVKVSLAGASDETEVIERTLQPIWYKTVSLSLELPRDLSLAPKVSVRTQHSSMHNMAAYGHRK